MSKLFYPAVFHSEETGYSVSVPDLDGCFTEGDTLEEAYNMAFDAIGLYITDILENGKQLPKSTQPNKLKCKSDEFIALVEFNIDTYRRKHSSKSVKKTLTIPSWLNDLAEKNSINFSAVLQDGLKKQLNVVDR